MIQPESTHPYVLWLSDMLQLILKTGEDNSVRVHDGSSTITPSRDRDIAPDPLQHFGGQEGADSGLQDEALLRRKALD